MKPLPQLQFRLGKLDQLIAECTNAIARCQEQKQFAAANVSTAHREAARVLDLRESYARAELLPYTIERERVMEAIGFITAPPSAFAQRGLSLEARTAMRELPGHGVYDDNTLDCDKRSHCLTRDREVRRKAGAVSLRGRRQVA